MYTKLSIMRSYIVAYSKNFSKSIFRFTLFTIAKHCTRCLINFSETSTTNFLITIKTVEK